MTDNNSDKRGQARVSAKQRITAYSTADGTMFGHVANFHDTGFMLLSSYPLRQNALYSVRMEFAKLVAGRDVVQLGAECMWTRTTTGNQLWAGFHITEMAPEDRHLLAELAAQLDH